MLHTRRFPATSNRRACVFGCASHPRPTARPLRQRKHGHASVGRWHQTPFTPFSASELAPTAAAVDAPGQAAVAADDDDARNDTATTTNNILQSLFKGAAVMALSAALLLGGGAAPALAARSAGRAGGFAGPSVSSSRSYGGGGGGGGGRSFGGGGGASFSALQRGYVTSTLPRAAATLGLSRGPTVFVQPPFYNPFYGPAPSMVTVPVSVAPVFFDQVALVGAMCLAWVMLATAAESPAVRDCNGAFGTAAATPTLARLRVGVLASTARHIKASLDSIASAADTASREGLQAMLQDAALLLLRASPSLVYGSLDATAHEGGAGVERAFAAESMAERAKFEAETLVNVRGRRKERAPVALPSSSGGSISGGVDEVLVVTLLVAFDGRPEGLPARIDGADDVAAALRALASAPPRRLLGAELLWTPQAVGDWYGRDELAVDYPELRSL